MRLNVKQISTMGIILSICIFSQFLKNTSVYITGPIINICLIIITLLCGVFSGVLLSIITPITSFFITGSPVIAAIPLIMPIIMIGNCLLVIIIYVLNVKLKKNLLISMILGAIVKSLFMGLVISAYLVPTFLPERMYNMMPMIKATFSITQLITSLIAAFIVLIIFPIINKINIT